MHVLLFANPFLPLITLVGNLINWINVPVHNLGWSLIIFALLVRLVFWPLNTSQFKTMVGMQKIAPRLKAIQAKYKSKPDPQAMQREQMALYKEAGVNPMAGCLPLLIQMPIIISVYYAVTNKEHIGAYAAATWAWIGSAFSQAHANIMATSLKEPDLILLLVYIVTMYLSIRYTSMPATDPAQARTQKMMAILSPAMIAYFGFRAHWPSAMILYWTALNVFTMAQQLYLLKRYHQPLSVLDSEHAITEGVTAEPETPVSVKPSANGSSSRRNRRRKRSRR
ncbi:MAG: membrane protein insertase YidC [Candidatus Eremiobacteraeota bacterium]|nr:membrane protein insertase YidC [Candidatus Eremiobacteraeota bacterium]